jgi:hypothetical protein
MSYSILNPPSLIAQGIARGTDLQSRVWEYSSADDLATVTGINYINNAAALSLKAGDRVIYHDTGDGTTIDLTAVAGATTGTAAGATGSAIEPIGETSIALSSAGTGTILIGDVITFGNGDLTEYEVTTGDTDVSDGGTLVITPGLVVATAVGTPIKVVSDVINLAKPIEGASVISGLGATKTLSRAENGSTILFDRAAGIVVTLPASVPGLEFEFVVTVDLTAAAYAFVTDGAFLIGSLLGGIEGAATDETHFADGTSHVGVSMNKTTTGGLIGGKFKVKCISATLWTIEGNTSCTATPLTPFTT